MIEKEILERLAENARKLVERAKELEALESGFTTIECLGCGFCSNAGICSACQSRIASALSLAAKQEVWQPIESAPKDGTEVLTYDRNWSDHGVAISWYAKAYWQVQERDDPTTHHHPTHWQPLPPSPILETKG